MDHKAILHTVDLRAVDRTLLMGMYAPHQTAITKEQRNSNCVCFRLLNHCNSGHGADSRVPPTESRSPTFLRLCGSLSLRSEIYQMPAQCSLRKHCRIDYESTQIAAVGSELQIFHDRVWEKSEIYVVSAPHGREYTTFNVYKDEL